MKQNESRPTANWAADNESIAGATDYPQCITPSVEKSIWFKNRVVMTVCAGRAIRHAEPDQQLQKPPAWALNESVYAQCRAAGAEFYITDCAGIVYTATAETMEARGFWINRGWGKQWVLPLRYWATSTDAPTESEPTGPKPDKPRGQFTPPPFAGSEFNGAQMALFGDSARAADALLDDVGLLPSGKHRKAARRAAHRMTGELAQAICKTAGGGQ